MEARGGAAEAADCDEGFSPMRLTMFPLCCVTLTSCIPGIQTPSDISLRQLKAEGLGGKEESACPFPQEARDLVLISREGTHPWGYPRVHTAPPAWPAAPALHLQGTAGQPVDQRSLLSAIPQGQPPILNAAPGRGKNLPTKPCIHPPSTCCSLAWRQDKARRS